MTTHDDRPIWSDDDMAVEVVEFDPIEAAIGETLARRIFCDHRTQENDVEAARHIARCVRAYRDEMAAE